MLNHKQKSTLARLLQVGDLMSTLDTLIARADSILRPPQEILDQYAADKRLEIQTELNKLAFEEKRFREYVDRMRSLIKETKSGLKQLAKEKASGFPWLAKGYAELFYLQALKEADLMAKKKRAAKVSADRVRDIAAERRAIEQKLRVTIHIIEYYQTLFPFLEDLLDDADDDLLRRILGKKITDPIRDISDVAIDPVRLVLPSLSDQEFARLSSCERNQLALDRYWSRKSKTNWELGKEYERFIGYTFEREGYSVRYQGILEGYDDLGRDLICSKQGNVVIVQCKRWSKHRTIRENHVTQLYGTLVKYQIESRDRSAIGALYTTTTLSERAGEFASHLGVIVRESYPFQFYPSIKCNVSRRTGERIYHLPFDQQYDRAIIESERNECYVATVKEAEDLGFRRAWKWLGKDSE
ncbi:MAG: restriction endonuclease [candidate division Zixibacteria bacterium]|nr:restriction endonuclease [candidate division Zixibacteria bacterium]